MTVSTPLNTATSRDRVHGSHLHIDPVTGVSGDMPLSALVDASASLERIRADLKLLGVPGWRPGDRRGCRCGDGDRPHRRDRGRDPRGRGRR